MKNLIRFFKTYRYFFVFLIIQFVLLRFYFKNIQYPRSAFFSVSNSFNSWLYEKQTAVSDYWNLAEMNDRLREENKRLKEQQNENFVSLNNKTYYAKGEVYHQKFSYIPARVINGPYQNRNNFFTINKGKSHGLHKNMGVYNDQGIVGFVVNVSNHYALVKTLLTESFNISAMIKKNKEHGLIKWNGRSSEIAQLTGVPKDVNIEKGDTIVTKGSAGIFPENIMVGTVSGLERKPGVSSVLIDFETSVDFSSVYDVYVVINYLKEEQETLEKTLDQHVEQ